MLFKKSFGIFLMQASSSSMMEPLAAQIVMMELAHVSQSHVFSIVPWIFKEHDFEYDSLTTDRSTSMKSLLRYF